MRERAARRTRKRRRQPHTAIRCAGGDGAADERRASTGPRRAVGVRQPLVDGVDKVTGRARYTADIAASGALVGASCAARSRTATIRRIDTARARALPGVHAVVHRRRLRRRRTA